MGVVEGLYRLAEVGLVEMELVPPEEKWLGLEGSDKPTCVDGG